MAAGIGGPATRYLERPEGRIAYDVTGEGPLVVCVPGMGDLRSVYRFLVPELATVGFRVATMDLRGHGESDATFTTYDDVAAGGDPHTVRVEHGMTRRDLVTVSPKTDIAEAAELMVARNIRHLPVADTRGRVVGIISIRDLTRWAAEELSGGHEMPDIARSHKALRAANELAKKRRRGA